MATSVYFNNQGASREQMLLEDMVIESIRNHGIDVYYIPRTSQSILDTLFGDDPVKYFDTAYKLDVYLNSFADYGGQQEFFSKFGLQIEKTAKLALARRTFERFVPTSMRTIPLEGDMIYLPAQKKLMEIRFVERDASFFQLGKFQPYMYVLSTEAFKYNGEFINTGIEEIDLIGDESAVSTNYNLNASDGSASFSRGEVAYQGTSANAATARGIVVTYDRPTNVVRLRNIKGSFTEGVAIKGNDSGANFIINNYDILDDATIPQGEVGDNVIIQEEADAILDFSETNPFGTP
jgi:hypothetical protein